MTDPNHPSHHPDSTPPPDEPAATAPPAVVRLRFTQTALLVLAFLAICALPAAYAFGVWGIALYVVLILIGYCIRRVGATITRQSVIVRGPFYSRRIPRQELAGLTVSDGGGVFLLRTNGSRILLPTARPRDLPRLRILLFDAPPTDPEAA